MVATDPLEQVRAAPADVGTVELVVRRPDVDEREVLDEGLLDAERGLVGDRWVASPRRSKKAQLTLMSSRAIELVAGPRENWPPAGDQLYVDFDLSKENVPPGTRLQVGGAVVEVTDAPHLGCNKFEDRYGEEARTLVNSPEGVALNLRGVNACVVRDGTVRPGDAVRKL